MSSKQDIVLKFLVQNILIRPIQIITPIAIGFWFTQAFKLRNLLSVELLLYYALCFYLLLEVCFYFYYKMQVSRLSKLPKPPPLDDVAKQFKRCLSSIDNVVNTLNGEGKWSHDEILAYKRTELTKWFFGANLDTIYFDNVKEWICWAFYHSERNHLTWEQEVECAELLKYVSDWCEYDFRRGYNPDCRCLRLTFDDIPSIHRPFLYYFVTQYTFDVIIKVAMYLFNFKHFKAGSMDYWMRDSEPVVGEEELPPLVMCHGLGVGVLPYLSFVFKLVKEGRNRTVFMVCLPHISMRIHDNVPSAIEMVHCIQDMLVCHDVTEGAHFVGHSFGSIVLTWVIKYKPSIITHATFIDPVCFLLIKSDVAFNFMYREPQTATQLLIYYFLARELYIAHSIGRKFYWFQNILWAEDIHVPYSVVLSRNDSIVPSKAVYQYLKAAGKTHPQPNMLHVFHDIGHAQSMIHDMDAQQLVRDKIRALETKAAAHRKQITPSSN